MRNFNFFWTLKLLFLLPILLSTIASGVPTRSKHHPHDINNHRRTRTATTGQNDVEASSSSSPSSSSSQSPSSSPSQSPSSSPSSRSSSSPSSSPTSSSSSPSLLVQKVRLLHPILLRKILQRARELFKTQGIRLSQQQLQLLQQRIGQQAEQRAQRIVEQEVSNQVQQRLLRYNWEDDPPISAQQIQELHREKHRKLHLQLQQYQKSQQQRKRKQIQDVAVDDQHQEAERLALKIIRQEVWNQAQQIDLEYIDQQQAAAEQQQADQQEHHQGHGHQHLINLPQHEESQQQQQIPDIVQQETAVKIALEIIGQEVQRQIQQIDQQHQHQGGQPFSVQQVEQLHRDVYEQLHELAKKHVAQKTNGNAINQHQSGEQRQQQQQLSPEKLQQHIHRHSDRIAQQDVQKQKFKKVFASGNGGQGVAIAGQQQQQPWSSASLSSQLQQPQQHEYDKEVVVSSSAASAKRRTMAAANPVAKRLKSAHPVGLHVQVPSERNVVPHLMGAVGNNHERLQKHQQRNGYNQPPEQGASMIQRERYVAPYFVRYHGHLNSDLPSPTGFTTTGLPVQFQPIISPYDGTGQLPADGMQISAPIDVAHAIMYAEPQNRSSLSGLQNSDQSSSFGAGNRVVLQSSPQSSPSRFTPQPVDYATGIAPEVQQGDHQQQGRTIHPQDRAEIPAEANELMMDGEDDDDDVIITGATDRMPTPPVQLLSQQTPTIVALPLMPMGQISAELVPAVHRQLFPLFPTTAGHSTGHTSAPSAGSADNPLLVDDSNEAEADHTVVANTDEDASQSQQPVAAQQLLRFL